MSQGKIKKYRAYDFYYFGLDIPNSTCFREEQLVGTNYIVRVNCRVQSMT